MGIWIFNTEEDDESYWNFIQTNNMPEFMQGFITMCNAFQVDFRNYILSPPFDSNDIEYDLVGYHVAEYF